MARRPQRPLRPCPSFRVVLVTAGSLPEARRLARRVLQKRVAACVSLLPRMESWYWWKGRVAQGKEVLLLIKTRAPRLERLYRLLQAEHSYEIPEFLALPVEQGSAPYLRWVRESLQSA